ncbi:AAA family ATPase [Coleofasciculus sp. LEGE 07092]|nr:AAA family ATPase [Coleofasciculus sp. LEGE 07081]MBE9148213.1 AAA family ATPase [Coleofasciculus sp. LEGE 07092]
MRHFHDWLPLAKAGTKITALESHSGNRQKIFEQFHCWGELMNLPVYFGNPGSPTLRQLQREGDALRGELTDLEFPSVSAEIEGIIVIEGFLRDIYPQQQRCFQLKNIFDTLSWLPDKQQFFIFWEEDYIQLPLELQSLIPLLRVPLPTTQEIWQQILTFCQENKQLGEAQSEDAQKNLLNACRGLSSGEIDLILQRSLAFADTLSQLAQEVLQHKINKLRGQGLEYLGQPDVEVTGGLDLLDLELQKVVSLLDPKAQQLNLEFPKGILLWGPPGTGKSLSAKLSAKRMGIPLIAADWGALLFADSPDSALRNLLEITESISPCVLYWDDFDKGFSGWDSNANGGVARRLSGRLLTWMQERTAPVFMVATVNRLHFLPPELIRRFEERIFFVDLPHKGARYDIFNIHLRKYFPLQFHEDASPWSEDTWRTLLREYNLTTPAEIGNAVRQTAERIFHCHKQRTGQAPKQLHIEPKDLLYQRKLFTPAMIRDEAQIWEIRNQATFARPATGKDTSKFADSPQELFG